ncbi:MAG TPA: SRPBCC family protein [Thermoanaerobaculia bacterium]|jgi:carbon monoxide dehydrogenase subunit G|nr:SRPBCC family protein [Thermoanaerobaculia bacterium]
MEITKSFVVKAPAAAVWEFLTDPYRVGRCLPGAAITDKVDDQTYAGTITIKVGPVTASYRGKMRFERLDPVAMEADIAASGQETKGKGGADMRMKSRVVAKGPDETEVTVVSDVNVMGVLAQFGRGMIQDVSDQLFQKFTVGMRRELETPPAAVAPAAVETAAVEAVPEAPAAAAPAPQRPPSPALPPPAIEDVLDVGSLGAKAAGRAAGRALRGPIFWIAVILLALLVYWLTHH